ncbi:MerR family transcriptional regulator [Pseudokineococcus sp. 1T1Z-3]|uniref:MerR family transcriptional regulator n=1 Tax=Pseudokineococcus sp. 1T1Z-3 TaxID=3132745 RepID=UPI003096B03A
MRGSATSPGADDGTGIGIGIGIGITQAAREAGLSVHTLRYYEDQGLLRPDRDVGGRRTYRPDDLRRLRFVRQMRRSGMSMQALRRYVALSDAGPATVPERQQMMLDHAARVAADMQDLAEALATTRHKIRTYDGHPEP